MTNHIIHVQDINDVEISAGIQQNDEIFISKAEVVNGEEKRAIRKIPFNNFTAGLVYDVEYDTETEMLYLINARGSQIGNGTLLKASLDGLTIKAEDGYDEDDNIVQYIALYDADNHLISRTEVSINVSSISAGDTVKLVNRTEVNGTVTNAINTVMGAEGGVTLAYDFYIYDAQGDLVADVGTARYTINGVTVGYGTITQGRNRVVYYSGAGGQLAAGDNTIAIRVMDSNGNSRSLTYNVTVINLNLASNFNANSPFVQANLASGAVPFTYIPYGGDITKTVHFELDGAEIDTVITKKYNTEMSYPLNGLSHGNHILRVWMTAVVNETVITSNILRYDFLYVRNNGSSIIMSVDREENTDATQGDVLTFPYLIYASESPECRLCYRIQFERANEQTGSMEWATYYTSPEYSVDRTRHTISIKDYPAGNVRVQYFASASESGSIFGLPIRSFYIDVAASDLGLAISTVGLDLMMDASGRSNAETEETVGVWRDLVDNLAAELSGFDWKTNGWMDDALKVSGGAEAVIPYYPFRVSPIATGASGITVELDFMTGEVSDGDAVLLSCMANGIGFEVRAEEIVFSTSAQSMSTPFEPGKRIRAAIVVEAPGSQDKLMHLYINGVDGSGSGIKAFSEASEIIQQNAPISLYSDGAAIWVYGIRVYTMAKDRKDTATNYIASLPSIAEQTAEYNLNQIYDTNSGAVTRQALHAAAPDLTIVMLEGPKMPTAKVETSGDVTKEDATVSGEIIDPDPNLCIRFENQKIAVQGTSSAAYYRKNWKQTIKKCALSSDESQEMTGYTLRVGSLPAQKLCFKKDVASSEQANNVLLARLYNDACPYKTPPQLIDSRVRQGIDGKPCVIFFTCTDPTSQDYNDGQPVYYGKYNMNIDKGSENVFGFDMEDELGNPRFPNAQSWEFSNNTSPRCLFQTADFVTVVNGKPEWMNDFEARYPEDSTDTALFNELCSWIASTNTANATGNRLPAKYYVSADHLMKDAVVYETYSDDGGATKLIREIEDSNSFVRKIVESSRFVTETIQVDGVEYTVMPIDGNGNELYYHEFDTANYRQEVFYQELSSRFALSDVNFYYAFTEFFLMVDNRAKNQFLTYYDDLWCFLPYDFDTANGINNEGELAFSYGLEATDTVGGAYVFNDHMQSVLWTNFMNTFFDEIAATVRNLDSAGWLSPDFLVSYFAEHQSAWPVSLWNEDENWTYSPTLTDSHDYLPMWQGKKEAQREWWIRRRAAYIFSKYLTPSALSDVIEMRVYTPDPTADNLSAAERAQISASAVAVPASADMTITPYQDVYVNTKWGSYDARARAYEDTPVLMETPAGAGTVNDTETYVYSASTIKDLGDLSALYVGRINISNAKRLESLVLGSANPDYANLNCSSVTVSRNTALKKIDVRGLVNLTGNLLLENCPNITEIYAERTRLAAVTTPNGGCIRTIHLPGTITSLSLCNQTSIEDFRCDGFSNVQSLRVENCPALEEDLKDILAACVNLTHVRLIDVDWQEDSADTLVALTYLGGLDENGSTTETAVVTGRVNIANCSADDLARIKAAFPHLTVTYTTATARLTYVNGVNDQGGGGEVLFTLDVPYGGTGYYPYDQSHDDIEMPTLESTPMHDYTFDGWAGSITNVTTSRTITALYTSTVREYPVAWVNNDDSAIRTDSNVTYGTVVENRTVPSYLGNDTDMVFAGWTFYNTDDGGTETVTASEALTGVVVGRTKAKATFVKLTVPDTPTPFSSCTLAQIIALIAAAADGTLQAKTGYANLQAYGWAVSDECVITLKSGESVTLKIWGFDINEDENENVMPVTIGNKYALLDSRQMNTAARYLYGYTVSDTAGDASVTNERTAADYTAYEFSGTPLPGQNTMTYNVSGAGTAEITFTERTWLTSITVTDGGKTFTYYFDGARSIENAAYRKDDNYFAQEDCSEFTRRDGCVLHRGTAYLQYTNQNTGDVSPRLTIDGTNGDVKVLDRLTSTGDYNSYRAIEFMPGSKITIPFTGAGRIVITSRGLWNGGGHICTSLRAWLLNTYIDQLPAIIQQRLVPVKRVTGIGGLDWDDYDTYYDKVFLPSYRELGYGSSMTQPYCNENNVQFPTFSSNEMRLISCYRGGNQELLLHVWSSSPNAGHVDAFIVIHSASGAYGGSTASYSYALLPGFCLR